MRVGLAGILIAGALLCGTASAQTQAAAKPEFDVASVHLSAPLDRAKLAAQMAKGEMPNFGMHLDGLRAEYNYMSLKQLVLAAYKVKSYEITCPDWMDTEHYDIVARMPVGSTRDDAAEMLKSLLQERFHLKAHVESQERPVLALVVAKGGPKLKDSPAQPPIDESAPLQPGERKMDMPDGPARMTMKMDPKTGAAIVVNMGDRGTYNEKIDFASQSAKIDGTGISMAGFVDILSQIMQVGGGPSKPVIDQTGLKGHYEVELNLSLADLMAAARTQGGPQQPGPPSDSTTIQASDPGGAGSSVYASVEKLGLKLNSQKAVVQQLVVDSADKTPTAN